MCQRASLVLAVALFACASPGRAAPRFGVMTDVGVPDGANASLVVRPVRALRFAAGLGDNLISRGVRGELAWVPFGTWLSPTVAVGYGHYADGDANPIARRLKQDPAYSSTALDRVGYDYATARVGFELGQRWFAFYLDAGITRLDGTVRGLGDLASSMASNTTVTFTSDPTATVWTVSARLGFILYLAK